MSVLLAAVSLTENTTGLPGIPVAKDMAGALITYGLIGAIVGVILSAGLWAVGAFSQNHSQTVKGKTGLMVAFGAALVIGAANFLISFFQKQGASVTQ